MFLLRARLSPVIQLRHTQKYLRSAIEDNLECGLISAIFFLNMFKTHLQWFSVSIHISVNDPLKRFESVQIHFCEFNLVILWTFVWTVQNLEVRSWSLRRSWKLCRPCPNDNFDGCLLFWRVMQNVPEVLKDIILNMNKKWAYIVRHIFSPMNAIYGVWN